VFLPSFLEKQQALFNRVGRRAHLYNYLQSNPIVIIFSNKICLIYNYFFNFYLGYTEQESDFNSLAPKKAIKTLGMN
jgi:hypothetical protein